MLSVRLGPEENQQWLHSASHLSVRISPTRNVSIVFPLSL